MPVLMCHRTQAIDYIYLIYLQGAQGGCLWMKLAFRNRKKFCVRMSTHTSTSRRHSWIIIDSTYTRSKSIHTESHIYTWIYWSRVRSIMIRRLFQRNVIRGQNPCMKLLSIMEVTYWQSYINNILVNISNVILTETIIHFDTDKNYTINNKL